MSDFEKDDDKKVTRRQAAKTVLVGGGLLGSIGGSSGEWVKPVIKNVALPVHAGTTDDMDAEPTPIPEQW